MANRKATWAIHLEGFKIRFCPARDFIDADERMNIDARYANQSNISVMAIEIIARSESHRSQLVVLLPVPCVHLSTIRGLDACFSKSTSVISSNSPGMIGLSSVRMQV